MGPIAPTNSALGIKPAFDLAALLLLLALTACVAPGSGATDLPPLSFPNTCAEQAPRCITSCSTPEELGVARCDEGIFRCEQGMRQDLCCDPENSPERCPEWGAVCRDATPCMDGYTCVTSRSWPLPDTDGVCRLGDWSIPDELARCEPTDVTRPEILTALGQSALKVEGVVQVEPTCDTRRCDAKNPCCQRCTGVYTLEMADRQELVRIGLRTETLSCLGTNCGFSCSPLQPGRRYRLWGMWVPHNGAAAPGSLFMSGFCAL